MTEEVDHRIAAGRDILNIFSGSELFFGSFSCFD
jgi:hypothetical protein